MRNLICTIGADLGTGSTKVIAFDPTGTILAQASKDLTLISPRDDVAEQDPLEVYTALNEALSTVAQEAQEKGYHIARVGLSAAMHSFLPVSTDGTPLANALLWMDARAQKAASQLWASPDGKALYQRTGTPIHAMTFLAKLLWLHKDQPDLFAQSARFISLKEWIWQRWFGEWQIDHSMASTTGLFNFLSYEWDQDALSLANITSSQLSQPVPTTYSRAGLLDENLLANGFSKDTIFTIGATDGVLANLGAQAIDSSSLVLTIGTSCAIRTGGNQPYTNLASRPFCYLLDRHRFIIGSPSNSGGILLDWLYKQILRQDKNLSDRADFQHFLEASEQAESIDLFCLPYVAGERAPLWNAEANASFFGLQLHHKAQHLMRAAIEGMLFNLRLIAEPLLNKPEPPTHLIISGKLFGVEWLRQLTADIFALPVSIDEESDASVRGAALLAEIATRQIEWPTIGQIPQENKLCLPRQDQVGKYQLKFSRFCEFYNMYQNFLETSLR